VIAVNAVAQAITTTAKALVTRRRMTNLLTIAAPGADREESCSTGILHAATLVYGTRSPV
jgi:hypothetical protein